VSEQPSYLTPYQDAARRHNGGFGSLLWASPDTQAARFDAICRLQPLAGRTILDVGCGRGDLLDYLVHNNQPPADYIGIEVIDELLEIARRKEHRRAKIIAADFVANPKSLFVGAEMVVICGALNTLDTPTFYTTIRRAFDAAAEVLVFNFLDSPSLAAASFLTWHRRDDVLAFARSLSTNVRVLSDYLDGDSTIAMTKN
jgi:SAM-dependent methyltransferase